MANYLINWTPANLADDGRAVVRVQYQQDRLSEGKDLFVDYEHTQYGNREHLSAIIKRVLGYHIGRDADDAMVARFIARPTQSSVIVTEAELDKFFGEDEGQWSLRI
jgi:hypothetical protein